MSEHFEIRQEVRTVEKNWLVPVHIGESRRLIEMTYQDLVKNNPDEYFEFVHVVHTEKTLDWSPKFNPDTGERIS